MKNGSVPRVYLGVGHWYASPMGHPISSLVLGHEPRALALVYEVSNRQFLTESRRAAEG